MVLRGKSLMNYMLTSGRSETSSSRHQHRWVQCVRYDGSPIQLLAHICLSTQSPPRTDYAKKEHFPDVDNSRAQLSGEEYGVYAAAEDELQEAWDNGFKTYDAYSK